MKTGQINRGSKLGEHIYELSKRNDVKFILDIGTWNGLGSTKCILDAVKKSNIIKYVWSLECNKIKHEEAKINLGLIPPTFKLIHGSLINYKELENIKKTHELFGDEPKWIEEDIAWIRNTPLFEEIPENIDLCIIDGGEFSGNIEFFKLKDRCKYIVLDDTRSRKNKESRQYIVDHPEDFEMIDDNINDRNGYLICKNINL